METCGGVSEGKHIDLSWAPVVFQGEKIVILVTWDKTTVPESRVTKTFMDHHLDTQNHDYSGIPSHRAGLTQLLNVFFRAVTKVSRDHISC